MNCKRWIACVLTLCCASRFLAADEPHRSPLAFALSADRHSCLTANYSSGSVSLVDLVANQVQSELQVGRGPAEIAWVNESTAVLTLRDEDAIALIQRDGTQLRLLRKLLVGDEPQGLAVSSSLRRVFVATAGDDAVAVLNLDQLLNTEAAAEAVITQKVPVGGLPRTLALSPDQKWLVTCCATPCEVFVHDTASLEKISARKIFDGGFNPGTPTVTADSKLVIVPSAINRAFAVTAQMIDIGWVIDNRISKLPLPDGEPGDQKQLGLDIRGKAVGDANCVALSPDEQFAVVACGGTHELLVLEYPSIPWPSGDPGDFLPDVLRRDESRFRRIKLGGRPVDVSFIDQRRVLVANYLEDCLQVVDIEANRIVESISLGGPTETNHVRRGEIVFYDADRSLHSWFSCHTCHPDGHTAGQVFDTRNDQSYGTPKLIPSLRGVAETGPWTWHGWQTDLKDAMQRSLKESMNTEKPISRDDLEALVAYMETLKHPDNPRSNSASQTVHTGRQLFEGKAGCVKCHAGPTFTTSETFDGAVEDLKDRNKNYNPPTLRGVSTRRRFLHTGRAKTLEQVLTKFHRPEDTGGEALNDEELATLIEYLKSL